MGRNRRLIAPTAARSQQAFTLVELLIVVGLLILLSAVAFPMLTGTMAGYRARTAAWQVAGHLRLARAKAVSTRRHHRVCLRDCSVPVPTNGYLIERSVGPSEWVVDTVVQAPSDQVQVTPYKSTTSITFDGRGGADPWGTVTLEDGSSRFKVTTAITGRVKVCKEPCS